jgi:hypothetical protein
MPGTGQAVTGRISRYSTQQHGASDDRMSAAEVVVSFMPAGLVDLYERLVMEEFGSQQLGSSRPGDRYAIVGAGRASGGLRTVKSGQPDIRAGARPPKIKHGVVPIRSERALHYRSKIDRKLRKVVAELRAFVAALDDPHAALKPIVRRCAGRCHKFGDIDWTYCPRCGGPMAEAD